MKIIKNSVLLALFASSSVRAQKEAAKKEMRYHGELALDTNGEIPLPELGEPHDTFDWVADHDWFEDWMFDLTPEEK